MGMDLREKMLALPGCYDKSLVMMTDGKKVLFYK
jgi:hypothetical protein